MGEEVKNELAKAAKEAALPSGVSVITVLGVTLQNWILILTLIYLLCQIVWLALKIRGYCKRGGKRE